ncbi:hypothetical protein [Kribbella sp. NPDC048928]|uniref:hypothetical protein n=1 Tax=Kribbella sp. NPDC048928 TaxID=3364111 RepID=UPI003720E281
MDPPVAVERADAAWVPVGFVDAWVLERGVWVARVKDRASRYSWIPGTELRRAGQF